MNTSFHLYVVLCIPYLNVIRFGFVGDNTLRWIYTSVKIGCTGLLYIQINHAGTHVEVSPQVITMINLIKNLVTETLTYEKAYQWK